MSLPSEPTTVLGVVYLSAYLTAAILGGLRERREREMPRWLFACSCATLLAESAGMFLYLAELGAAWLAAAWAPVFAFIVLGNALEMRFAYRALVREPEPEVSEEEARAASAFAVVATMVFALPSLWMNFRLAFG